ncbi:MAG: hypothetical protein D3M94_19850 [Rhodocyclales bacterium GT-UBC]|nr:MAG: hypothetical protein D3M94_19850 [Rhodocyclales bacterium GT-UBC]
MRLIASGKPAHTLKPRTPGNSRFSLRLDVYHTCAWWPARSSPIALPSDSRRGVMATKQQALDAGERQSLADLSQSLQIGLSQLSAMLVVTYGSESFRELADDVQDRFLWGLHDKSEALEQMAEALTSALVRFRGEVSHG